MKNFSIIGLFTAFLMLCNTVCAQVGVGTTTPHASAQLDISSENKGLLIPRMDLDGRTAIQSPATGLMIFQTDNSPGFYFYNGTAWEKIGAQTTPAPANFTANGTTLNPFFTLPGAIITNWTVLQAGTNGIFTPELSIYTVTAAGTYKLSARINYSSTSPLPILLGPDNDPAIIILNPITLQEYARGVFPITNSANGPTMASSGTILVEGAVTLAAGDQLMLSFDPDAPFLPIVLGSDQKHVNGIHLTISKMD
ncbi:hypothetical protein GCM10010967_44520 [Dyadobacter beijingensis]|uniref:C1q domain-containing protein n=1 Tax=Dyadobacter beijingensis TaxID=365489 RepID=A0ABQ2IB17_9BACT|nr:hypothetical protein [Dyadobacter beijingensis]GGN04630.1 hypothetical protein GCM10010967_44520 [Dyadobacter beijingensis]